jgi:ATP-binding cassette subfamily C protein CydC
LKLKAKFLAGWSISALQSISSLALLATSAWLLSKADQRPSIMYLSIAVVGVRAFALGKALFRYSERLVLHDATFRKATSRRTAIFASLINRAPIGLTDTKMGSLVTSLVDDTEESLNDDLRYRPALIQSVAVTFAGVAIYCWLIPKFAALMILVLLAGALGTFILSKFAARKHLEQLNNLRSELSAMTENIVARNRVIQAYGWQLRTMDELDQITMRVTAVEKSLAKRVGRVQSAIVLATYLTVGCTILVTFAAARLLPGEQVAVLVLLPLGIFEYLQALPAAHQAKAKASASILRLEILEGAKTPKELLSDGTERLEDFQGFNAEKVMVRFPNGSCLSLPDLKVVEGESVSLVGRSGSGKSTFANLLVGFLQVYEGSFSLNGKPVGTYSGDSLRENVGLVEQQPVMLAGSVKDNLLLAAPSASDNEMLDALKDVQLWPMLEKRQGLDTDVGQRGSKLSGGEVQRIAFARNLLAKRKLVILDEPTSSLDKSQATEIVRNFLELGKQKGFTVLLITHDKKLAQLTDRLVEF